MDYKSFEEYIKQRQGEISIPEAQTYFECGYREAKEVFDRAVKNKLLKYKEGVTYEILPPENKPKSDGLNFFRNAGYGRRRRSEKRDKNKKPKTGGEAAERVKEYIKNRESFTVPELQNALYLDYVTVREIINGLVNEQAITFDGGLNYKTVNKTVKEEPPEDADDGKTMQERLAEQEEIVKQRRDYLKKMREELIRRMNPEKFAEEEEKNKENEETYPRDDGDDCGDDIAKLFENGGDGQEGRDAEEDYDSVKHRLLDEEIKRRREEENRGGVTTAETAGKTEEESRREAAAGLVNALNGLNPAESLVRALDAANPVKRLSGVLKAIAAKKEAEQQLQTARGNLLNSLKNLAAAQDDGRRLAAGGSYSAAYFATSGGTAVERIEEGLYKITFGGVDVVEGLPFCVYLWYNGNKTYISDGGAVFRALYARISDLRADSKITNHTIGKPWIIYQNRRLNAPTTIETAAQDIHNLYFAMRALLENF